MSFQSLPLRGIETGAAVLYILRKKRLIGNLVPKVSPLPAPGAREGGGKRRDPGNEVG